MDDYEYLAPGFEPSNLKIAELRNILLKHDVPYPSTAKKPELVTLFERNIKANAESILSQFKKVKPSARGIQNVPGLVDVPSPSVKKTPGRKKASKILEDSETEEVKEEVDIEIDVPIKGGKKSRALKKAVSTASTLSEVDQDGFVIPLPKEEQTPPPSVPSTPTSPGRRGRTPKKKVTALSEMIGDPSASESDAGPSVKTPKRGASSKSTTKKPTRKSDIKKESTAESQDFDDVQDRSKTTDDFDYTLTPRDKSPFSDYNPFQQGTESSPEVKDKRHNRRGRSKSRERTPTRSTTASSGLSSPIGLSPQQLIKKFMSPPPAPSDTSNVSAVGGSSTKSKGGRRRSRLHSQEEIEMEVFSWSSIFFVMLIPLIAWGLWYRYATIKVGFCDDDGSLPIDHSLPDKFPDEDESAGSGIFGRFSPTCTPCPFHGLCDESKLIGCDDGFIPYRPIHALGGLIPQLEQCRPDTVKQQAVVQIAEAILYELSVHAGKVICGTKEMDDDAPDWEKNGGMRHDQLWDLLEQARSPDIDHERFREYWGLATKDLMRRSEQIDVIEQASSLSNKPDIIFISKQPKLWFSCRVRKDTLRALYEYRYHEFGAIFLILSLWASYAYVQVHRRDKRRVAVLVHTVLGLLADQERLHYIDNVQTPYPYLAITQLRDHLLQDEPNRDRLWHKAERVVAYNSNVRERVGDIRGEQHRVWEWVGSIASPSTTPPGSSTHLPVDAYGSPVPYPAAEIAAAGNGLYPTL